MPHPGRTPEQPRDATEQAAIARPLARDSPGFRLQPTGAGKLPVRARSGTVEGRNRVKKERSMPSKEAKRRRKKKVYADVVLPHFVPKILFRVILQCFCTRVANGLGWNATRSRVEPHWSANQRDSAGSNRGVGFRTMGADLSEGVS